MRFLGKIIFLFVIVLVVSCTKEPTFPDAPHIKFKSMQRFTVYNDFTQSYTDSINIVISFEDGDGDLGLSANDLLTPYQPYDIIKDKNDKFILLGSNDTLPSFDNCHYVVDDFIKNDPKPDTVLIKKNLNFFNYFAELYVKENGVFEKMDLSSYCPYPFYGRFPVLNPDDYSGTLDGDLTFNINDPALRFLLEGKTAKFKIFIKDRALNKSNIIETDALTFTY